MPTPPPPHTTGCFLRPQLLSRRPFSHAALGEGARHGRRVGGRGTTALQVTQPTPLGSAGLFTACAPAPPPPANPVACPAPLLAERGPGGGPPLRAPPPSRADLAAAVLAAAKPPAAAPAAPHGRCEGREGSWAGRCRRDAVLATSRLQKFTKLVPFMLRHFCVKLTARPLALLQACSCPPASPLTPALPPPVLEQRPDRRAEEAAAVGREEEGEGGGGGAAGAPAQADAGDGAGGALCPAVVAEAVTGASAAGLLPAVRLCSCCLLLGAQQLVCPALLLASCPHNWASLPAPAPAPAPACRCRRCLGRTDGTRQSSRTRRRASSS